ncbi:MAG: hypothetical protein QJR02_08325 [Sinobacteraceae bacterium]|nr:hypothetical protein [Nevskiaceae bacterium]
MEYLLRRRGGTRVYLSLRPGAAIAALLTPEEISALIEELGEGQQELPPITKLIRVQRNLRIRSESGCLTSGELAVRYGVSHRQVRNIRAQRS